MVKKHLFFLSMLGSIVLGGLVTWMILGTYPFWIKYSTTMTIFLFIGGMIIFCAIYLGLLTGFDKFISRSYLNKTTIKKTIVIGFTILIFTILIRHQIPISFSYSFKPGQIFLTQQIDKEFNEEMFNENQFEFSIRPGFLLLHPIAYDRTTQNTDEKWVNKTFEYTFFPNRLTKTLNLDIIDSTSKVKLIINVTTQPNEDLSYIGTVKNFPARLPIYKYLPAYYFSYAVDLFVTFITLTLVFAMTLPIFEFLRKVLLAAFYGINGILTNLYRKTIQIFFGRSFRYYGILVLLLVTLAALCAKSLYNFFLAFISICLVLIFAILLTAILKITNWSSYIISVIVTSFANVLLVTQISGLLNTLASPAFLLAYHALLVLIIGFIYFKKGKPRLIPSGHFFTKEKVNQKIEEISKNNPGLIYLIFFTILGYFVVFILAVTVPANIDDILTTYFPRAGFWIQQGSFNPWPTSNYNLPQNVYPLNGQLPLAWIISLWGNAKLTGLIQFVTIPLGFAGIYGLAKVLGASNRQSLFLTLLFLGLPEVIILSSTALTDLLVANMVAAITFLFIKGIKEKQKNQLFLSGLAFGIILGIKQTVFFLVPGYILLFGILWFQDKKCNLKPLLFWIGTIFFSFIFLSSFIYLRNFFEFKNFFGPSELTPYFTHSDQTKGLVDYVISGGNNFLQLLTRSFFDNLPNYISVRINRYLAVYDPTGAIYGRFLPRNLYEFSVAWSGQIGFIFLLTTFFVALVHSLRNKKWDMLGIILIILSYTTILLVIRTFTIASARYLLSVVVLIIPLSYLVIRTNWVKGILIANSIIMIVVTLLFDGAKPLIGPYAIWNRTHNEMRNLVLFDDYLPTFEALDQYLPTDASLAYYLPDKFPQSVLFGENFTRTLTQLNPEDGRLDEDDLADLNADYLVVQANKVHENPFLASLDVLDDDPSSKVVIYSLPASTRTDGP